MAEAARARGAGSRQLGDQKVPLVAELAGHRPAVLRLPEGEVSLARDRAHMRELVDPQTHEPAAGGAQLRPQLALPKGRRAPTLGPHCPLAVREGGARRRLAARPNPSTAPLARPPQSPERRLDGVLHAQGSRVARVVELRGVLAPATKDVHCQGVGRVRGQVPLGQDRRHLRPEDEVSAGACRGKGMPQAIASDRVLEAPRYAGVALVGRAREAERRVDLPSRRTLRAHARRAAL